MIVDYKDPITGDIIQMYSIDLRPLNGVTAKRGQSDDIDLIAHKELGAQDYIQDLIYHNSARLVEKQFDLDKINQLDIPIV